MRFAFALAVFIVFPVLAQEKPVVDPVKAPAVLTDEEKLSISLAMRIANQADAACRTLDITKEWLSARNTVNLRLQTKYPGYQLDWSTQKLVPIRVVK